MSYKTLAGGCCSLLGRNIMPLHTPSKWTFWLSVILVVLAIIVRFAHISPIDAYAAWLEGAGYLILVIGCTIKTE
jgi:hypothetical protein